MKIQNKRMFLSFLFISLLVFIVSLDLNAEVTGEITGETVTGETTSSNVAFSISIMNLPTLTIQNPENKTYLNNESILLNYSVINEDYLWYNLDSGSNTTITSSRYINVTQGTHTLYLYSNNSQGETEKNVTFTANSSKFIIIYNEYAGANKGSSTDFNVSTYEDIQNLSNVILEQTTHGKITFNEVVNLTADSDFSDMILNLDTNTNISSNRIELNSVALPNLNKTATLILYGLTFSDPRILMDGSVCSSQICTQNSYSGGNLSFNVTRFTVYSAEETPASESTPSTGGGDGGGGTVVTSASTIEVDKDIISITLKQGETLIEELTIKNTGNSTKTIILSLSEQGDFLLISESSFDLGPGESRTIILNFIAKENTLPDLYQAKLLIKIGNIEKEVLISMEVESRELLFDVKAIIPMSSLRIKPGGELLVNIQLFNLGKEGKVNISLEYSIRDKEGNLILAENETIEVETMKSFVKKFQVSENLDMGDYIFYIKAIYEGKSASASMWFKVILYFSSFEIVFILITFLTIIFLIIFLIIYHKLRKDEERYKRSRSSLTKIS